MPACARICQIKSANNKETSMKAWRYKRGEWTEIDDPLEWHDGEDFAEGLQRSGYYKHACSSYGNEFSGDMQVYAKREDRQPYLVCVCFDGSRVEHVFIDDFPSMMEFLRDFVPLFTQIELQSQIDDMKSPMEKAFQAWHGHGTEQICRECAPVEWEEVREFKRKLAEKKTNQAGER
jgi:hypothetical protein